MSIIGKAMERKMGYRPGGSGRYRRDEGKPTESPKILDLQILKDYIPKVLDYLKPVAKPEYAGFRKHSHLWEVPIHHLLGKVNEPTWVFMIEQQARWIVESWQAVQPNGRWQVFDYEITTETRNHTTNRSVGTRTDGSTETLKIVEPFEFLLVGIQIVDIRNGEDLLYDMGRPSTRRSAPAAPAIAPDSRIASQQKQMEEQKVQIDRLQSDLNKQNELMTALLSELQQQKTPSIPVKKRSPRK